GLPVRPVTGCLSLRRENYTVSMQQSSAPADPESHPPAGAREPTASAVPGPSLTVQAVLELDEVKAGEPELLSGAERLATPVRWVHIADTGRVGSLLEGGELVLSTGQPFR